MDGRASRRYFPVVLEIIDFSEYNSVLSGELSESILNEFCVGGGLRTSSLRSIVWRVSERIAALLPLQILLKCLPVAKTEWITIITRTRNKYEVLKRCHITNPHDQQFSQNPEENNPLSEVEAVSERKKRAKQFV